MEGFPQQVNGLQDLSQQVQKAAWDIVLSRYISAAALTWLLYDHVLTFEKERTWIWSNKLTITKVLFLINRYSAPVVILVEIILYSGRVALSDRTCQGWLFFEAIWQSLTALIVQFLLGLRMCAIWGSRPWTKAVLYIGCLVCAGASLASITVSLAHVSKSYQYSSTFGTCYTMEPLSSWLWAAFFLPIMAFDLLIFLLTIWNAFVGRCEHLRKESLAYIMWRDGAIYFILIFASELACVIISARWGFSTTQTIKFLVWSLQNVVISHMTLNLVEAVRRPEVDMVPTSFLNMSTRDLSGRPSTSMIWKARKSGMVDTMESRASPIIFTRTLPSHPDEGHPAAIISHEDKWTQDPQIREINQPLAIGGDWNDPSPIWADMMRGDEAQWSEVYTSGKEGRSRALVGSSSRAAGFDAQQPGHPEAEGAVMSVGTGRSRLLTSANQRTSILTKEDLAELMGRRSSLGHDTLGLGLSRHGIWGSDTGVSDRMPSEAAPSSEGYHPVTADLATAATGEETPTEKRKRLDQLVQALTTPPSPTVPLSPRRPGFF